ncbi:hypothetical protein [Riemerella columbina]|uniref:hypothetical protein n=1 Tax=Riemerella columbina TaxID=103810 RepID=UPI00037569B5|nr:hypothetical protein [Riemerella columbina]
MKKLVFILMLLCNAFVLAQDHSKTIPSKTFKSQTNTSQPEFPGGLAEFQKIIYQSIIPQKIDSSGRAQVTFTINEDGTMTLKNVFGTNTTLNKELERVFLNIKTKWKPALSEDGKPKKSNMRLPVIFNYNL